MFLTEYNSVSDNPGSAAPWPEPGAVPRLPTDFLALIFLPTLLVTEKLVTLIDIRLVFEATKAQPPLNLPPQGPRPLAAHCGQ